MGKTPRVSVIIVNWNGARYLNDCIGSVKKQSVSPVEVIVIDNDSSDASREVLKLEKEARIVLNDQNVGFSAACNQGIRISQAESILVMNPDVVLEKHYLDEVLRTLALDPWIGSVTGKVLRFDHQTIDTFGFFRLGKTRKNFPGYFFHLSIR
jgi:GT2 family glycosyltransferase